MDRDKFPIHFSIIIATQNRSVVLEKALTTIFSQSYFELDVIIAHTGIGDGTFECVKKFRDGKNSIHYIVCKRIGAASQRNEALGEARGDWVFFLDDDVELQPDFFEEIVSALRVRPDACGISGRISNQYSKPLSLPIRILLWMSGGRFSADVNGKIRGPIINFLPYQIGSDVTEIDWMPTCVCGYKREIVNEVGGFPDFFKDYSLGEDIYLSMKVKQKYPLLLARKAVLFHNYLGGNNARQAYAIGQMQIVNRFYILKEIQHRASYLNLSRLIFWNFSTSMLNFFLGHKSVVILWNSWRGYASGFFKSFALI